VAWHLVDDAALGSLTETVHPQGVVAICAFLDVPVEELLRSAPRLLAICADVRDPGNAGTVIRCADAAGAEGVLLTGSSVDPYNGKAVRASVGSLFHLPLALPPSTPDTVDALRAAGLTVLAADGAGEVDLDDALDDGLLSRPTAWLFGNEAHGLPDETAALADHRVRIPMHGRAESLNLATAAAVCLYASARSLRRPSAAGTGSQSIEPEPIDPDGD
jgi:TrmH family RNA methyltransferase